MTPWLSDAEISELCCPLEQPAAQLRYLRDQLHLHVERKPNGRPLVMRSELERARALTGHTQIERDHGRPSVPWEETPLGRLQALARAERAASERAAAPRRPSRTARRAAERAKREARVALVRHHAAKRRAARLRCTPIWADDAAIRAIYGEARRLTLATGVRHDVDHVIPLQGRLVSGLHVETNLQILPARENSRKRNRFTPC